MSTSSLTRNRSSRNLQLAVRGLLVIALLSLAGLPGGTPSATAQAGQVVINELMYHPTTETDDEWLELHNSSGSAVDLSGWAFTDGIDYTFPPGTILPAGGYLVVARNPARVEALYGISGVLGPYDGRLSNGGERVALSDVGSTLADEVTYSDATPWPTASDGDGPSLELVNPAFDNDRFCAWQASVASGTPGAANSVYAADIPPCVEGVAHAPVFPTSAQSVTVTAWVQDNEPLSSVTLYYHPETQPDFAALPMRDDGAGGDVTPGDGLYTAVILPQANGAHVEFYVEAIDGAGLTTVVPTGAPRITSSETGHVLSVSYLYQVEDVPPSTGYPTYRLIFTAENWTELTTRDLFSDERLDATFVYNDQVYYNVGVRYRGESSRDTWPRPYRVHFSEAHLFDDGEQVREKLNLVSDELAREFLLWDLFQRAGIAASQAKFASLFVNEGYQGLYLDVEQVDEYLLARQFPGDHGGNLYRGEPGADLSYLGPDPDVYRPYYLKKTNEAADDYSDVIALTDALTNAPDETFQAETEALADMAHWVRWFAVQAVVYNDEGALWKGQGDDYFLYHRPSDDRFVLLSWDHDNCFNDPRGSIWAPNLARVRRILEHPPYTRLYYQNIASLVENEFSHATMGARIDALPGVLDDDKWEIRWFMDRRIPSLNEQIPDGTLSITTNGGADFTVQVPTVTLEGTCSPLRDVSVDGDPVATYPAADSWRYTKTLQPGPNPIVVTDGRDTRTIVVTCQTFTGGPVTDDLTLYRAGGPYHITQDIVVQAGATLTIEPGTELYFSPGSSLMVYGRLLAEGTAAQPIVFTGEGGAHWGAIAFYHTTEDNRIAHAMVEWTTEETAYLRAQGITAYDSTLTLSHSVVRHTEGSALHLQDSTATVRHNEIYDVWGMSGLYGDGLKADGGQVVVEGNHLHDVHTPYGDGVQFADMTVTPILRDNHVHHIPDDCVDLNHSPGTLERNVLHDCGDKGISLGHVGSTSLANNLIYNCAIGIAVKDSHQSAIANVTVADCTAGLALYQAHAGEGGGHATVVNSILWSLTTPLDVRDGSTLAVTYSDVQSGTPGEGNIAADPLFRSPAWDDYRLQEESPCVDSGTPQGAPPDDLKGIPRPIGPGYDMGAYEFFEFFEAYLPLVMRNR